MSRKNITAKELLEQLANDEEFQKREAAEELVMQKELERLDKDERPLVEELNQAGFSVNSAWDLVNSPGPYKEALPILMKHLDKPYENRNREGIIRALTVHDARGLAGDKLIELFKKEEDDEIRWVIGNALSVVATEDEIEDIVTLLEDTSYGEARGTLVAALGRIRGKDAIPEITVFLEDQQQAIYVQAIMTLGKLKAKSAKKRIEKFLNASDSYVRNEAKKALKKIA